MAHRGSEWVNFVITCLSGGHLQAGESGNPGPSRHSRETCPRMPLSGSGNPIWLTYVKKEKVSCPLFHGVLV
ncbi:MAG TPA: hypothetical protein VGB26_03440 [Nitrospiria bacterium]